MALRKPQESSALQPKRAKTRLLPLYGAFVKGKGRQAASSVRPMVPACGGSMPGTGGGTEVDVTLAEAAGVFENIFGAVWRWRIRGALCHDSRPGPVAVVL